MWASMSWRHRHVDEGLGHEPVDHAQQGVLMPRPLFARRGVDPALTHGTRPPRQNRARVLDFCQAIEGGGILFHELEQFLDQSLAGHQLPAGQIQ